MRLRSRRHGVAPLLLVLLPTLATALVASDPAAAAQKDVRAAAPEPEPTSPTSIVRSRRDVGTKAAPVDGKDGKPHEGPFVEVEHTATKKAAADSDDGEDLAVDLPGRPEDPTIIDGKKIPEVNDGVMDDKDRQKPKKGTTGTEGGVSEKDAARKAEEGKTGEKVKTKPETPKEAPPLPHSEQEKILSEESKKDGSKDKEKTAGKSADSVAGLEKPEDLPDKPHDKPHPVPDSANKDHLDLSKSSKSSSTKSKTHSTSVDDSDGLIHPFHSFFMSLTMILFAEVGDKTFLIAALMAMKHDRAVVFSAAYGALFVMTVLSAVLGHAVPTLLPQRLTSFLAAALFFVFGARMLREGMAMSPDEGVQDEMHEVERELAEKEKEQIQRRGSVTPYALEMGYGNGRKPRSKSRFPTPPRSPSTSPGRSMSPLGGSGVLGSGGVSGSPGARNGIGAALQGLNNLLSLLLSPAWVQTFVMTFLGEWGDRSQIATIAMAAGDDYWLVVLGALLGHAVCTGVAVLGGRAIAGRVSMKVVTMGGAFAFLVFGFIYFFESFYS